MVEHWTENSKDLSEEIQISGRGGGGGYLQRRGMIRESSFNMTRGGGG